MTVSNSAQLQWVSVNNVIHHVSEFATTSPAQRPAAFCPACGESVIFKLGEKKVHHAAHRPHKICKLNQHESVVHYNCKMHLWRALLGVRRQHLWVESPCTECGKSNLRILARAWTDVRVEYRLPNGLVPDISLWQEDQLLSIIEIVVSHEIDDAKASLLAEVQCNWVEIHGNFHFYASKPGWTINRPLIARQAKQSWSFKCLTCQFTKPDLQPLPMPMVPSMPPSFACDYQTSEQQVRTGTSRSSDLPAIKTLVDKPPLPSTISTSQPVIEYIDKHKGDRHFDGKSCINCGNTLIAYASNSGPLCTSCCDNPNIRALADARIRFGKK